MADIAEPLNRAEQRRHRWRNTIHTWILIAGFCLLAGFIAFSVFGWTGLVWTAAFAGIGLWSAGRATPKLVLRLYDARPLRPHDVPQLERVMRELSARAGLPAVPQLYYVPSRMMNAFAVGSPRDSAIAVTDGLIRGLTLRQLAGVLAHEVSHVRNGDLKVMALADALARMTSIMATVGLLGLALSVPAMMAAGYSVPWPAVLLLVLAPTIGGLLQLALSRAREYDADLDAAGLTGDPDGLASALMTLERRQGRMWEGLLLPGSRVPHPSILRTHPKTEERVERLRALRSPQAPRIDVSDHRPVPGRTIVPVIRPPRVHAHRLGLWY